MDVVDVVGELYGRGRTAWPDVELSFDTFAAHVARRIADASLIARLCAEDLYLACACARGEPHALAAFEAHYGPVILRAVSRIDARRASADEMRQQVMVRLLVARDGNEEPRIDHYSGRGSLEAWVRIAAGRLALNERRDNLRKSGADLDDDLAERAMADAKDPEVVYLRQRYQGVFKASLEKALVALGVEQRSLLRLHYIDGLTMDALAELFRTSRAGIHRKVAAARAALFDGTCERLRGELGLDTQELESMLRLVRSELDVSLLELLRQQADAPHR